MAETLRLGDHCEKIGSGATPRGGKETYSDDGPIALIRSQNIYNDGFYHAGLAFISQQQANQLQNVEVREGDVLLNITGDSVARACQVDPSVLPARVNQHVAIIRPNPKEISSLFLRYYLVSPAMQAHMLGLAAAGATRNALTKTMIEDFRVPAWSVGRQFAVASVLSALDDKINLNQRMNQTLETMARSMFKDWFVDFGPTRAKMSGSPPYLSPEIWALFPDQVDEDGKPDTWHRIKLREAAEVLSGGTPSKEISGFWNGSIPWVSPKGMSEIHVSDSADRVTAQAIGNGTRIAPSGSVLLMVRGMGLHQGVRISQARRDLAFNQDVKALMPKRLSATHLLFGMLDSASYLYSKVETSGHGTGKLATDVIDKIEFVSPNESSYAPLISVLEAINERIASNNDEIEHLNTIRDFLLPKMMSGEIRVKEAELIIDGAA